MSGILEKLSKEDITSLEEYYSQKFKLSKWVIQSLGPSTIFSVYAHNKEDALLKLLKKYDNGLLLHVLKDYCKNAHIVIRNASTHKIKCLLCNISSSSIDCCDFARRIRGYINTYYYNKIPDEKLLELCNGLTEQEKLSLLNDLTIFCFELD